MIKTKQPSPIVRILKNINQSWGVAIGFLMLLFIIPFAIIVSDPSHKNLTVSNADNSKPLVLISPQQGQGKKAQFIAEVRDTNIDKLESVDLWLGANIPQVQSANGNYVTIRLNNFAVGTGNNNNSDWRATVYNVKSGNTVNLTSLAPDDDATSNLSKIYSSPSTVAGDINLSTIDSAAANASIKYRKFEKISDNTIRFYLDVEFKDNFSDKNVNSYMKAQRAFVYGGASSGIGDSEWTNVGTWVVTAENARSSVAQNNAPKFTSLPVTKATVGTLYKYEIGANDPEGDIIKYQISSTNPPSFLTLTKNVLSGTPTTSDIGNKNITVTITDSTGNSSNQEWSLVVSAAVANTPTSSSTLNITSPKSGDTFKPGKNNITWTASSTSGIASYKLTYALQGSTDNKIIFSPDSTATSYSWDTSSVASGTYTVKLEALDTSGKTIASATSSSFQIDNSGANIQSPKLTRRTPEESVITDTKPTISAVVNAGSADPDLSTLVVTLDDQDITSKLDKGVNSFSYKPLTDLSYGNHTVKVVVKGKDSAGDKGVLTESWTFTISQNLPGSDNQSSTSSVNKITLPILGIVVDQWLGTIIIGLFVILLFAILIIAIIALYRILKGNKDDDMTHITKYYQKDGVPPILDGGTVKNLPDPSTLNKTVPTAIAADTLVNEPVLIEPLENKPDYKDPLREPTMNKSIADNIQSYSERPDDVATYSDSSVYGEDVSNTSNASSVTPVTPSADTENSTEPFPSSTAMIDSNTSSNMASASLSSNPFSQPQVSETPVDNSLSKPVEKPVEKNDPISSPITSELPAVEEYHPQIVENTSSPTGSMSIDESESSPIDNSTDSEQILDVSSNESLEDLSKDLSQSESVDNLSDTSLSPEEDVNVLDLTKSEEINNNLGAESQSFDNTTDNIVNLDSSEVKSQENIKKDDLVKPATSNAPYDPTKP